MPDEQSVVATYTFPAPLLGDDFPIYDTDLLEPEFKTKWIQALRSGEYDQGSGFLRQPDASSAKGTTWCCIGVACDIINSSLWAGVGANKYDASWNDFSASSLAFGDLREFPASERVCLFLAIRNDGRGAEKWDFNQIADFIEQYL